ncbi:MAG: hypothetical protein GTN40_04880 [Candidatus Aenigmarchaeota archaeon]|nr:hypothetical protein [Candidatus Aenigmarchaeota archaeon]
MVKKRKLFKDYCIINYCDNVPERNVFNDIVLGISELVRRAEPLEYVSDDLSAACAITNVMNINTGQMGYGPVVY